MSIENHADLEGLRAAGRVVARAIRAMRARVRPGISTGELDRVGARIFAQAGARSGPQLAYDFPGVNCIGIGRHIHEWPTVPNYPEPTLSQPLTAGLVITIEPIVCAGSGAVFQDRDGWTIKTRDGTVSAHVEHTIVITDEAPIIITA